LCADAARSYTKFKTQYMSYNCDTIQYIVYHSNVPVLVGYKIHEDVCSVRISNT
jgi:hypothetical protein